jgi:alkanesulfonate monooxygenase SsuD/methylene tetrahydromethanopterin reductase-like flavin-dependent oxidoreductase (luciferase family)
MFAVRYDMRRPDWATADSRALYAAALDQAAFVDEHGLGTIVVSEHHASPDGYLPSPLVFASAVAARTTSTHISLAAVIATLHDPVRLAEDVAVLDLVSGGRVSLILGLGYRPEEYEHLGIDWRTRGKRLDDVLTVLLRAWTGEPFEWEGRRVHVTPRPLQEPHPFVLVGGSTAAAARRAARFGLGFFPTVGADDLKDAYVDACAAEGREPGIVVLPQGPAYVHVADDPDKAWADIGDHLLHDARTYASWQPAGQRTHVTPTDVSDVESLRAAGGYLVVTPDECVELVRKHGSVILHPLIGGLSPDLSWPSLELIAQRVKPKLTGP